MKKFLMAIGLAVAVTGALASTLTISDKSGKKVGTATYSLTKAGGRLTTKIVFNFTQQGNKFVINMVDVHSATGNPVSSVVTTSANMQGKSVTSNINVTYSGRKATVVSTTMGKSKTTTSTAGGSVTDKSMVWVASKFPPVGTSVTYYGFEPMGTGWEKRTAKYVGLRSVKLSRGTAKAHCIVQTSASGTAKLYFTSSGDLLRLETPQFIATQ